MYTENYRISVILTRQQEGGYTVKCEDLPEFLTDGNSVDEALANVGDAFVATLELYSGLGRELPESIRVAKDSPPNVMKTVRFQTMTPRQESEPVPN